MANDTDGLLTAQNARIQNLEAGLITQGQGLLALEQTQQQILQQLQANNQLLQQISLGQGNIPSDLVIDIVPRIDPQKGQQMRINHKQIHYGHLHAELIPVDPSVNSWNVSWLIICSLTCNYIVKWRITCLLSFEATENMINKINEAMKYGQMAGALLMDGANPSDNEETNYLLGGQQKGTIMWRSSIIYHMFTEGYVQNAVETNGVVGLINILNRNLGIQSMVNTNPTDTKVKVISASIYAEIEEVYKKINP